MAVSPLEFSKQIDAWVAATKERTLAVFHESTQRVVSEAQSRIPIDTGFARASIHGSLSSMPQIDPSSKGEPGQSYGYDDGEISLVINGAQLGQTIYCGWTAAYVQFLEYGHSKQAPAGFVRISALMWPQIVNEVTAELKSRAA